MRITILRLLLALPTVLLLAMGALYLYSAPKSLDVLNDFFPGDSGVERVAADVPFGPYPNGGLDVYARPAPPGAKRPVLVFFYGGGWANGRRQDYGFAARAYAARGFVVVLPDYRKVPGVRFPVFLQDGAAAIRWTHDNIARFGGDPDKIVTAGHSAGRLSRGYGGARPPLAGRGGRRSERDPRRRRAGRGL